MINSLDFGKYIKDRLDTIEAISGKTYPIVAENSTKYPFVVYKRVGLTSNSNKDTYFEDSVNIEIMVVAQKYNQSVDIASKVRQKLEIAEATYDGMEINDARITSASEDFIDNAYVQKMLFNFKIN